MRYMYSQSKVIGLQIPVSTCPVYLYICPMMSAESSIHVCLMLIA